MRRKVMIITGMVIVILIGLYIGATALYHTQPTSQLIEQTNNTPK